MMTGQNLKYILYGLVALFFLYSWFGDSSEGEVVYEEIELPTQGLATILQETEPELFKIEDEQPLASTEESIIVAKYLDGQIDTFTLAEVRLMEQSTGTSPRNRSLVRAASAGFFGYMLGRSMSSPVRSSAYMDQKTYNRVNSTTGNQVRSTTSRTTRAKPSSGKSGYGGKSTRSYGG
ncbi:MAG: hypothetical protein AAFW73_00130 [Bacteroidota bacterium]